MCLWVCVCAILLPVHAFSPFSAIIARLSWLCISGVETNKQQSRMNGTPMVLLMLILVVAVLVALLVVLVVVVRRCNQSRAVLFVATRAVVNWSSVQLTSWLNRPWKGQRLCRWSCHALYWYAAGHSKTWCVATALAKGALHWPKRLCSSTLLPIVFIVAFVVIVIVVAVVVAIICYHINKHTAAMTTKIHNKHQEPQHKWHSNISAQQQWQQQQQKKKQERTPTVYMPGAVYLPPLPQPPLVTISAVTATTTMWLATSTSSAYFLCCT